LYYLVDAVACEVPYVDTLQCDREWWIYLFYSQITMVTFQRLLAISRFAALP